MFKLLEVFHEHADAFKTIASVIAAAISGLWAVFLYFRNSRPSGNADPVSSAAPTTVALISPDIRAALVSPFEELSASNKKLIAKLEAELEINRQQVRVALEILGEKNVAPEMAVTRLREIAERFRNIQPLATEQSIGIARINDLRLDADRALNAGDLDSADSLLARAEIEQNEELDRREIDQAETTARRGDIAMIRLRYDEAAMHYSNAAELTPIRIGPEKKRNYLHQQAQALYRQGFEFGDNEALRSAISLYRQMLTVVTRNNVPIRFWT